MKLHEWMKMTVKKMCNNVISSDFFHSLFFLRNSLPLNIVHSKRTLLPSFAFYLMNVHTVIIFFCLSFVCVCVLAINGAKCRNYYSFFPPYPPPPSSIHKTLLIFTRPQYYIFNMDSRAAFLLVIVGRSSKSWTHIHIPGLFLAFAFLPSVDSAFLGFRLLSTSRCRRSRRRRCYCCCSVFIHICSNSHITTETYVLLYYKYAMYNIIRIIFFYCLETRISVVFTLLPEQ